MHLGLEGLKLKTKRILLLKQPSGHPSSKNPDEAPVGESICDDVSKETFCTLQYLTMTKVRTQKQD